ncbi:hypothetical protein ACFQI7_09975 [Paenibacillus allorhizosphaerae]|uniref:LysM domain-containing protein n=1 Tax=Paenibacillus allorhizosphaerae TaxID=2849866 RepID=A0ABM8VIV0_9BACL|nr:hypothetical protein [Paenibacillus allorhizosphaerae]CAG7644547.1 hypothetical protein PAECIP111802_03307 [Paenibacillus allorhizosphaerae]
MNSKNKKIIASAIAASFLIGAGFVGVHSQVLAADTGTGDAAKEKSDAGKGKAGMERGKGFDVKGQRMGGHGIGFGGGNLVKETATVLGVEVSAVMDELKQGKTLAQIAEAKGLALDAYVQKLVDAQTKAIDEQVAAGKLKQEQADKLKTGLAERLNKEVTNSGFGKKGSSIIGGVYDKMQQGRGPGFGFAGGNLVKETAAILGVEESAVQDELKQGKTLAQIAEAKGLALDAYVQKLVDAQTKAIDEQVAAGKLKQEQADKLKSGLSDRIKKSVESKSFGGPENHPGGHGFGFAGGNLVKETATILGVEESAIQDELKQGKTLAQIAEAKGLALDAYVQKLVDAQTKTIDEQVTAGKIKQEQADKLKSGLVDRTKKFVESKGFGGPGQRPEGPGFGFVGGNLVKETATILGVEESAVSDELKQGKTLAQIAEAKGLALDAYVQKLVDAQTKTIDEQVAAGKIKQELADKLKSGLAEGIKKKVQSTLRDGGQGKRHEAWAAPGELAQKLGMTTEELVKQLQAGKTVAELAKEKGITLDTADLKMKLDGKKNHKNKDGQQQETSAGAAAQ